MNKDNKYIAQSPLQDFSLWDRLKLSRRVISFDLELTARCNNNCRHCYINLPAGDKKAMLKELTFGQIKRIVDEAVTLGGLWCLLTGGEPLLRDDFFDIYLYLKKKGLLISVFTNATLITKKHIDFFKRYPPRDIEITAYGTSKKTYERITRAAGSFNAFMKGLNLLLEHGIKVRFKTMALRSNIHELDEISRFCRERTKDYFRFDPFLHLRFDRNQKRNEEIKSERLSPEEIVAVEKKDAERYQALGKGCDKLIMPELAHTNCNHLFHCGAGNLSFSVSYDGFFRLCPTLWHRDCIYDLKKGNLNKAWQDFIPKVRDIRSDKKEFLEKCRKCPIANLCMWCPGHTDLETGEMDSFVEYFCKIAHARMQELNTYKGRC